MSRATPRITPGSWRAIGVPATLLARIAGRVMGTETPAIFTTLSRNRRLYWPWLIFAGALMPGGRLPRADTELVILRVATLCGSDYERRHHERIGARCGLSAEQIAQTARDPRAACFDERQRLLLAATDELVGEHRISAATWSGLEQRLDAPALIELCQLAGHYAMLAGTLNSLGLAPDRPR